MHVLSNNHGSGHLSFHSPVYLLSLFFMLPDNPYLYQYPDFPLSLIAHNLLPRYNFYLPDHNLLPLNHITKYYLYQTTDLHFYLSLIHI